MKTTLLFPRGLRPLAPANAIRRGPTPHRSASPSQRRFAALLLCSFLTFAALLSGCEEPCHAEECHSDAATARDSAALSPAEVYCNCMLAACHDQYHAHFGPDTDEPAARAACLAEATALPSAGMPATSGNSLECRMHFCEVGRTDETMCGGSIGEAPCM